MEEICQKTLYVKRRTEELKRSKSHEEARTFVEE